MGNVTNAAPSIYTINGERKYLTRNERDRFIEAAKKLEPRKYAFALLLVHTGCRISEGMMVKPQHINHDEQCLTLRTLKRRNGAIVWRSVPAPYDLLTFLINLPVREDNLLFPWSRSTAYRAIKKVMKDITIKGARACPRGLRHTFGVTNTADGVTVDRTKNWMGHEKLESTLIYLQAVGQEEREMAARAWPSFEMPPLERIRIAK